MTLKVRDRRYLLSLSHKLREALNDVEKHLATIAESPYAMSAKDIEQLALAREVIEAALAEV